MLDIYMYSSQVVIPQILKNIRRDRDKTLAHSCFSAAVSIGEMYPSGPVH